MGSSQSQPCEAAAIARAENRVLRARVSRLVLNEPSDDGSYHTKEDQKQEQEQGM